MSFERKDVVVNGRRVAYWEKNPRCTKTMMVLHGFPGNHHGLTDMARNFEDYRVIMPDLPACGESEPLTVRHTLLHYSRWLGEFIKILNIEHPIIVGHSFGARVTLEFAANHPHVAEKIILLTPVVKVDGVLEKAGMEIGTVLPAPLRAKIVRSGIYQYFVSRVLPKSKKTKHRDELDKANMREVSHIDAEANKDISDEFLERDLTNLAGKVMIPVLVIAGALDEVATLESVSGLAEKLPRATLRVLPNTGHILPLEEPATVAHIITNWLEGKSI